MPHQHHRTRPAACRPTLLLAALLVGAAGLAGCAAGEADGAAPAASTSSTPGETAGGNSASTSAAPSPSDDTVEVAVQVRDGQVRPKTRRVDVPLGATVRLVVTSDVDDEIHVHGYDVEAELAAGREAVVDFVADQPGLVEVETHEGGLALVQLAVR